MQRSRRVHRAAYHTGTAHSGYQIKENRLKMTSLPMHTCHIQGNIVELTRKYNVLTIDDYFKLLVGVVAS